MRQNVNQSSSKKFKISSYGRVGFLAQKKKKKKMGRKRTANG